MDKKKKTILVIVIICILLCSLIMIITDASLAYKRNEHQKKVNEFMYELDKSAIENGYNTLIN